MIPSKASKAGRAYYAGFKAGKNGRPETENPFTTNKSIVLSGWWVRGFIEGQREQDI
ncbi:MAG: ribosome modulation factor [Methylobacter sp.]